MLLSLSYYVMNVLSIHRFPSTAIISFLSLPLIFPVAPPETWLQNINFYGKKHSELEQVNGELSSERRLMRAASRSHKREKWIMIMQTSVHEMQAPAERNNRRRSPAL